MGKAKSERELLVSYVMNGAFFQKNLGFGDGADFHMDSNYQLDKTKGTLICTKTTKDSGKLVDETKIVIYKEPYFRVEVLRDSYIGLDTPEQQPIIKVFLELIVKELRDKTKEDE